MYNNRKIYNLTSR